MQKQQLQKLSPFEIIQLISKGIDILMSNVNKIPVFGRYKHLQSQIDDLKKQVLLLSQERLNNQ